MVNVISIGKLKLTLHKVFDEVHDDMLDSMLHEDCQRTKNVEVHYDSRKWCR